MENFHVVAFDKPSDLIVAEAERICVLHKIYEAADPETEFERVRLQIDGVLSYSLARPLAEDVLKKMPRLKIIAHHGVGYDAIDVDWCARHGIVVTHTPNVLNEEVADLSMGLLIATVRQLPQADAFVRSGRWVTGSFPLTASLQGRTLGILGLGRIGTAIATRAKAFGIEVAYHNRHKVADVEYRYFKNLLELAHACDILLLIAPGTEATKHIVNREVLAALGADGILINVARGSLVDEQALVEALETGVILGAGLDVYEDEPRPNAALLSLSNTVLLPHVGSASQRTRTAMGRLVVSNLKSFIDGKGAQTPVPETRF